MTDGGVASLGPMSARWAGSVAFGMSGRKDSATCAVARSSSVGVGVRERERERLNVRLAGSGGGGRVSSGYGVSGVRAGDHKKERRGVAVVAAADGKGGGGGGGSGVDGRGREGGGIGTTTMQQVKLPLSDVARQKSPTKLPLASAARPRRQEGRDGYDTGGSAYGQRRRVAGSVSGVAMVDGTAGALKKENGEPQASKIGGLRKIEDAKINAAAGNALLRKSSVRDASGRDCGVERKALHRKSVAGVGNGSGTGTGNTEKRISRSGRGSRGNENRDLTHYMSRLSGSGNRVSSVRGSDGLQRLMSSTTSSEARRSSHRLSSLRVSSGGRESVNGMASTSTSTNASGLRSRNVSSTSVASANKPNASRKSIRRTSSARRVTGVGNANLNEPRAGISRSVSSRLVRRSANTSDLADTKNEQIDFSKQNPDDTSENSALSFESIRLKAEMLQLRSLHASLASNSYKKSKKMNDILRQELTDTETAYRRMLSNEQAAQSLINQIALQSWSYGGDGDASQTDNVALLITILDEFPALLVDEDHVSRANGNGDSDGDCEGGRNGGDERCYARLIDDFDRWIQHIRRVWHARGENGAATEPSSPPPTGPKLKPSADKTALSDNIPSFSLSVASKFGTTLDNNTNDDADNNTINPMPSSWHTNLATLCHKIDILNQSVDELDAAPDGSTLALVLQRCTTFLANAKREIGEMKEMERSVIEMEIEMGMRC